MINPIVFVGRSSKNGNHFKISDRFQQNGSLCLGFDAIVSSSWDVQSRAWEMINEIAPSLSDIDVPPGMSFFEGRKRTTANSLWEMVMPNKVFDSGQRTQAIRGFDDTKLK